MKRYIVWSSLALVMLAGGCGSVAQRQDQLISTHLAVLSVEDFDRARDTLNPAFKLTGDEALKRVNPTIGMSVQSTLDSLRASGSLGLDLTPDGNADVEEAPALPGSAPAGRSFKSPESFTDLQVAAKELGTSRVLEYDLAQSLFEHVAMLNATVAAAAIPAGYKGYIVQMQMSIMPRMQKVPCDVYADIAIFAQKSSGRMSNDMGPMAQMAVPTGDKTRGVQVIPLLSTDSLESVVNAANVERLRAMKGALKVAASRVNAGASVERVFQDIDATLGKQLFSSYSVAKLGENTLRVRLGAAPTGSGDVCVVPRTHRVPMLLLVPDGQKCGSGTEPITELIASAQSRLVNPLTGVELESAQFSAVLKDGVKQLAPYFAVPGGKSLLRSEDGESLLRLAAAVQENDQERYAMLLKQIEQDLLDRSPAGGSQLIATLAPEAVWLELASLVTRTQFTGVRFSLSKNAEMLYLPQEVFAVDNGKNCTIALPDVPRAAVRATGVSLSGTGCDLAGVAPLQIVAAADGSLQIVYPSFEGRCTPSTMTLHIVGASPEKIRVKRITVPAASEPRKQAAPLLRSSSAYISASERPGRVRLTISPQATQLPLRLHFTNGSILGLEGAMEPDAAKVAGDYVEVLKATSLVIQLTGLATGQDLTVQAKDSKGTLMDDATGVLTFRVQ